MELGLVSEPISTISTLSLGLKVQLSNNTGLKTAAALLAMVNHVDRLENRVGFSSTVVASNPI